MANNNPSLFPLDQESAFVYTCLQSAKKVTDATSAAVCHFVEQFKSPLSAKAYANIIGTAIVMLRELDGGVQPVVDSNGSAFVTAIFVVLDRLGCLPAERINKVFGGEPGEPSLQVVAEECTSE